jgi:hypothetical protein
MNYYTNACEQLEGAELLAASGKYRLSVTLLCLSGELFLKSLAEYKDPKNSLLDSHDIVGLGYLIRNDIDYNNTIPKLRLLRKYLNDSRYPFDTTVYTEDFYNACHEAVIFIKNEIDSTNNKKSMEERINKKFGKQHTERKGTLNND